MTLDPRLRYPVSGGGQQGYGYTLYGDRACGPPVWISETWFDSAGCVTKTLISAYKQQLEERRQGIAISK